MIRDIISSVIFIVMLTSAACNNSDLEPEIINSDNQLIITNQLLSENFVGNGAQWGGYDMVPTWLGKETLNDADWNKLFERIDFMRPPFLRIMISDGWAYNVNGTYDEVSKTQSLYKMLEYAQSRNIEITFGEWGHTYTKSIEDIDLEWVANSVRFLNHLINEKGFTCIKTANIINEPNGYWSSCEGSYQAWKNVQEAYLNEMKNYDLNTIKLMGPDIAIFNDVASKDWVIKAKSDFTEHIGLYDIHVYPKQLIVRNGEYTPMLQAYRDILDDDDRIVLGEIGFKYDEVDAVLKAENEAAIEADRYAGDDSNMMIYKAFYGIDMADAIIQSMRAGFSGALVWSMDDAMYNSPDNGNYQTEKLKRWGFWNILGEEHCGSSEDENIRPFFYPVSLLCRYIPSGSNIYNVELPNKKGLRAIVAEKNGKYTLAIVNSHYSSYNIILHSDLIPNTTMNQYNYKSNSDGSFSGEVDSNGYAYPIQKDVSIDFENGKHIELQGESFMLFTNMD